jgi:cellulose 1,4-beta-cellobiosidase
VQYLAGDINATTNGVKPHFVIVNGGSSSVTLSNLKIRYYFSENTTQAFSGWCDYAVVACSNITTSFASITPVTGADHYIEVGFTSGAGSLAAGANTGDTQIRFNKADWSNFTQTDDYSFDATKTAYTDWTKVTLYNNGALVWGIEPGAPSATSTATATATKTYTPTITATGPTPTRTVTPTATRTATITNTPTVGTPGTPVHLANPFSGAVMYINHDWNGSTTSTTGNTNATSFNVNTFLWLDSIAAVNGTGAYTHSLDAHIQLARNVQHANTVTLVIYDLPNRDCSALSSNGELKIASGGSAIYKAQYIDVIYNILSNYPDMRFIAVIEPDSLPNLITNTSFAKCQEATSTTDGYVVNTQYTLNKFYNLRNFYSYIDIGHAGWLGWPNNFNPAVTLIGNAIKGTTHGVNSIDGFIDNTANTQVETETFLDAKTSVGGVPVQSATFFSWNDYIDESHYATAWQTAMQAAGFPASSTNMLIDTSRNGWGGCGGGTYALQTCRPTKTSTSTVLETYVAESRIDRRPAKGDWCNQNGAGIGKLPGPGTAPYQYYVWVKPPGESDGSSVLIPTGPQNPDGKGLDGMCDPTYMGNSLNQNMNSNALSNAPLSGAWFQAQFDQLVTNKFP